MLQISLGRFYIGGDARFTGGFDPVERRRLLSIDNGSEPHQKGNEKRKSHGHFVKAGEVSLEHLSDVILPNVQ
jgi:hypothetical protein